VFIRPIGNGDLSDGYAAIDAEYLSEEELRLRGAELAQSDHPVLPNFSAMDFEVRHRENFEAISASYLATLRSAEAGDLITPAAEWLIDNFSRMEESARQVKRNLPRRYYRSLPVIALGNGAQAPRALAIAWIYAAHSRCEVTLERLTALVEGYQLEQGLRIGELWALPSLLRFVLLDDLARLARRIDRAREMRDRANGVADRLLGACLRPAYDELVRYLTVSEPHEADPYSVHGVLCAADHDRMAALIYAHQHAETMSEAADVFLELVRMTGDGRRPRTMPEVGLTAEMFERPA
jgi:hypothetical protein